MRDRYNMLDAEDWKQMYIIPWNGVQRAIARLYEFPQENPKVWALQQILFDAVSRADDYGEAVERAGLRGEDWEPIDFEKLLQSLMAGDREDGDMDILDWKQMYMLLLDGVTQALDLLPATEENLPACQALVKASRAAEEHYVSAGEND